MDALTYYEGTESSLPKTLTESLEQSGRARFRSMAQRPGRLLLLYSLLLAVPTAVVQRESAHWTSRLATVESLVARGTFAIEGSTYSDTVDKVKIGSHFYSHQPPAHAVLSAILYFPLYHLGLHFSDKRNAAFAILTFATNGLSTILALVLFFHALTWQNLGRDRRLLITCALACGTLILPYSTTFNVHGVMAAWLFAGFFALLKSGMAEDKSKWMFVSGFLFSLCAAMDHGTVFFYASFGAMLILRRESLRNIGWFILPACLTLLPTAAYYYVVGGSIKPFAARPELFSYEGSYWTIADPRVNPFHDKLTGEQWNSPLTALRYGLACLFGPHGFLIYNPMLVIAIAGLAITVRRRLQFWREATAIVCGSVVMMTYYSFASTNFGGASYSVRWFVSVLYLWWFFAPAAADMFLSRKWLAGALAAASLVYAAGGVANPWSKPDVGYSAPLVNMRRLLLKHDRLPQKPQSTTVTK